MKGILLAGGFGTRLYPITLAISKQLVPVHDKPLIYYSLSVLLDADIRDILIVSTPDDLPSFQRLFGDGSKIGCRIEYAEQPAPAGIAQAFLIGEEFISEDPVALVLGDNIFHGPMFAEVTRSHHSPRGAVVFATPVKSPQNYGVVEFDHRGQVSSIVEKPSSSTSNMAVPGLYFYDNQVVEIARGLHRSERGEYEITDVNREYLNRGQLYVHALDDQTVWLDVGTLDTLTRATQWVQETERRMDSKIGCIEEIAWRRGFIDDGQLAGLADKTRSSEYGSYLKRLLDRRGISAPVQS